jgi:vacuolar protein sorting-associated protein 11
MAVGFASGIVTVIRGDVIHDLGTKQRIIYESEEPITGVELAADAKGTTLFLATTARILKLWISKKGHSQPPKTVEDSGCGVGCMTIDKRTGDILVARDDALYYYTLEGRGPPCAYESPKSLVEVYGDYVALVCPPSASSPKEPDTMRRRFGGTADVLLNASTFVLLEPHLRIVGHTETLISPVKCLFQIWGDLFMLSADGKVRALSTSDLYNLSYKTRFIDIMRRRCHKDLRCSTKEICTRSLSTWLRRPAWTPVNRASYTASLETISTKKPITMAR